MESILKYRVLIIDDSVESTDILYNILSKDLECQVVQSGHKALKLLESGGRLPDLIILDIIMPGMDGFELCEKIKMDSRLKDIPIIFISSVKEALNKVKAFRLGGVDYIIKPFHGKEVLARIKTHLEISGSKQEIKQLYSGTIQGSIGALSDILKTSNPKVSRICNSMYLYSELLMEELDIKEVWDLKLACSLSGIGMLTENINREEYRYYTNVDDSMGIYKFKTNFNINKVYESLAMSIQILERIPKLEPIIEIFKNSMNPLRGTDNNVKAKDMESYALKGHILRILIYYFYKMETESNSFEILFKMRNSVNEFYMYEVIDKLYAIQRKERKNEVMELHTDELRPGMVLAEDVLTTYGQLLLSAGYVLSNEIITLIKNSTLLQDKKLKTIKI